MADFDRYTGEPIDNLASTLQSASTILSFRIGRLVMLRQFGGGQIDLLGRMIKPEHFAAYKQLAGTSLDLWEPRLHIRTLTFDGSVEEIRRGEGGLSIWTDYRPNGHHGDFTVERVLSLSSSFSDNKVRVLG